MKKMIALSMFVAACGPSGKAAAPTPTCEPSPATPLTLPELGEGSDVDLGAAVPDGWQVQAQLTGPAGEYALVTISGCDVESRCDPHVLLVVDGVAKARVPLPGGAPVGIPQDAPFMPEVFELRDLDGDGAPELWVGHGMYEAFEDKDGTFERSYLTLFTSDDLAVRWHAEVSHRRYFGGSTEFEDPGFLDSCDAALSTVDADCDGAVDIVADATCCKNDSIDPWLGEAQYRDASEREEAGEEIDYDALDAEIAELECGEPIAVRTVYHQGADRTFQKKE